MIFDKADYLFKTIVVGDSGVGKSSLLLRFTDNDYHENFCPTIGVDFRVKTVVHEDKSIKLNIWDTAGQEKYQTICYSYYKGADGILLVYDVTDEQSFRNVEKWLEQIKEMSLKNPKLILVGNKSDRINMRTITREEGEALADKYKMDFIETSAKSGFEVNNAFYRLGVTLMKEQEKINAARLYSSMNKKSMESKKAKGCLERFIDWCCGEKNDYMRLSTEDRKKDDDAAYKKKGKKQGMSFVPFNYVSRSFVVLQP